MASGRVDAFNPRTGRWRLLPRLPLRLSYAVAASAVRRIYVVGGFNRRGRPERRAFVLESGRWRALPHPPAARAAGGSALLDGKLYVVGGVSRSGLARDVLVFDLRTRRWSTSPGPRPRAYLGVAAVQGRIVAVGGRTGGLGTHTDVAESFDPGHREWLALPPAPVAVSEAAAARIGDLFISIGGLSEHTYWAETSVYAFNVATGTWPRLPDLVYPSHGAAAAVGGRLYALGGTDNGERFAASNDSHSLEERHIPASD